MLQEGYVTWDLSRVINTFGAYILHMTISLRQIAISNCTRNSATNDNCTIHVVVGYYDIQTPCPSVFVA